MPRPPRKEYAGALYHVTSRGNGRAQIFFEDVDRKRFLAQLQDCLEQYEVILYAYVLMANHYHLLVRTRQANLGRFMQRLNTSYALYSRYKHKKPGHRLEGRYKAKLVQSDEYILALTRYIHLNPVKVRAIRSLEREERRRFLEKYDWSSYRGYVDPKRREDFVCYDMMKLLGGGDRKRCRAYCRYVYGFLMDDDAQIREALERSCHGIGDEEFVKELEQELRDRKVGTDLDRDVDYPREHISADRIDKVVAREYGVKATMLKADGHTRGMGLAKAVAMELACRLTGLRQRAIGARYGGVSSQAVSHARRRVKTEMSSDCLAKLAAVIRSVEL